MEKNHKNYDEEFIDMSIEQQIANIIEVVINTHYNNVSSQLREDLEQEAFLKMFEKLRSGEFDTARNLRNFLYTVCRNTIHNFLYHHNKQPIIEVNDINVKGREDKQITYIEPKHIKEICNQYVLFGNFYPPIINDLIHHGLEAQEEEIIDEYDQQICNMVRGRVLWMIARLVD